MKLPFFLNKLFKNSSYFHRSGGRDNDNLIKEEMIASWKKVEIILARWSIEGRDDISFSLFAFNFRDGFDSLPSLPRRYLGLDRQGAFIFM